jgi:hypothetical protein
MSGDLKTYNQKILSYYQKVKNMSKLLSEHNDDSDSTLKLYKIYFELLDKMEYYNNKIRSKLPNASINKQLRKEITTWRNDGIDEYSTIKQRINKTRTTTKQQDYIEKLESTYTMRKEARQKYIMDSTNKLTSILMDNINDILDYSILLNESTAGNSFDLESLYTIKTKLSREETNESTDYAWVVVGCKDIIPPNTLEKMNILVSTFTEEIHTINDVSDIQKLQDEISSCKERLKKTYL